jgi:hypothetical protein
MPFIFFYFVIFPAFEALFCKKRMDESIFFHKRKEKGFPKRIYFPMPFPPSCLDVGGESFFSGLALLKSLLSE